MDPNTWEYKQQVIDAEIKSFHAEIESSQESIRALRHHRNALTPISSLPPEVITTIFSFLSGYLAGFCVSHVCQQWRKIALDQGLLWSCLDYNIFTSASAAEVLIARAKTVPLCLEASVPDDVTHPSWVFQNFQNTLYAHLSHICRLDVSAQDQQLCEMLGGLGQHAPVLEYLSLSLCNDDSLYSPFTSCIIPDTLQAPMLSCLELRDCDISRSSPLLKGLKYLDIRMSKNMRSRLAVDLDGFNEIPQLETLILHSPGPTFDWPGTPPPFDVRRTITFPRLTHLDVSSSVLNCVPALVHLVIPALARLIFTVTTRCSDGRDVKALLPYVVPHVHGPQDARPVQSVRISGSRSHVRILVWTEPDIGVDGSARADLSITIDSQFGDKFSCSMKVSDSVMQLLPLDNLVTLSVEDSKWSKKGGLRHAPRWSLLGHLHFPCTIASGFVEMLLADEGGRECPLLPSLIKLVLDRTRLSGRRTLRFCDAFMKRAEQGVPLETLDLSTCLASSRAVQLLREIVADVWGPSERYEKSAQALSIWHPHARGLFVRDEDSDDD